MASTYDAKATDPALLERSSQIRSYTTSHATYPGLRVFYRRHQQADRLPKSPAAIPLLVFIHGLGGSIAQFHPLLSSLTPTASCLAVDLPGCGVSEFAPQDWAAYSTDALVELLEVVIQDHRKVADNQGVVLIGHSMGASLAALLAKPRIPPKTQLSKHVVGLVGICPSADPPTYEQTKLFRTLLWIPGFVFDLWRSWDRRGGPESASVLRFVGADADDEAKRLQDLYNNQSKTPVWRRMAWGALPRYRNGVPEGGMPTKETWAKLDIPVFLVGGVGDNVTPPKAVEAIAKYIQDASPPADAEPVVAAAIPDSAAPVDTGVAPVAKAGTEGSTPDSTAKVVLENTGTEGLMIPPKTQQQPSAAAAAAESPDSANDPATPPEDPQQPVEIPPLDIRPKKVVEHVILPRPATHALLYTPATTRVLAGLVSDFLVNHVTGRLALGWQLRFLSRDGKWDVKNLEKWQKVAPVSDPIGGVFRAMKTLREVDEKHNPRAFVKDWGKVIKDIIDISHDNPVYDPQGLERGGTRYHKFPTVSKVPPTDAEIAGFIALVDKIRADQEKRAKLEGDWEEGYAVGVHCHYGFNRTGFFIVCYLVERCGYKVRDALEHFAQARPPSGIKHAHFSDRLYVRYSGLKEVGGR